MKTKIMTSATLLLFSLVSVSLNARGQGKQKATSDKEINDWAVTWTRTIVTAEVTYANTYPKGFSQTLAALGETAKGVKPSETRSGLIDYELARGHKGGSKFLYKPAPRGKDGKIDSYTLNIRPAKWHKGLINYFTDQGGVIRWTDKNRAANAQDPEIDKTKD